MFSQAFSGLWPVVGSSRPSNPATLHAMPLYQYAIILPDGEEGMVFEVMQKMTDPPLTEHPVLKMPVRRIISAPGLGGEWATSREKSNLSDAKLAEKGFTKYVKTGDGTYEKAAGAGPDQIRGK